MASGWIEHVKKFRAKHPGMSYSEALKKAGASWKKTAAAPKKKRKKK